RPTSGPIDLGAYQFSTSTIVAAGDVNGLKTALLSPETTTINLTDSTYMLEQPDNYWYGPTGLPAITGKSVSIVGNGATIERDTSAPAFRLFYVSGGLEIAAGHLTLTDLTLENGLAHGGSGGAQAGGGAGMGGAIYNQGTLDLVRVTLTANTAV